MVAVVAAGACEALLAGSGGADGCEAQCLHTGIGAHVQRVGDQPHRAADEPDGELTNKEPGIDNQSDQQRPAFSYRVGLGVHVAGVVDVASTDARSPRRADQESSPSGEPYVEAETPEPAVMPTGGYGAGAAGEL